MENKFYLKYIWEEPTSVVTFNGVKITVKKDEVFECSRKNERWIRLMYWRLFKKSEKPEEVKQRKWWDVAKKKVEVKKPLLKK